MINGKFSSALLVGAVMLGMAPTIAFADALNLTENPAAGPLQSLTVDFSLTGPSQTISIVNQQAFGFGTFFIGAPNGPGPATLTTVDQPIDEFFPSSVGGQTAINDIAWIEPGGLGQDLGSTRVNVLTINPNSNLGSTTLSLYSDLTLNEFIIKTGMQFQIGCTFNFQADQFCPVLNDGESIDVPLSAFNPNPPFGSFDLGTLSITFTDLGDVTAVPEPGTLGLMAVSLASLGLFARRRQRSHD